jgi:hypothetical protein
LKRKTKESRRSGKRMMKVNRRSLAMKAWKLILTRTRRKLVRSQKPPITLT